MGVAVQRVLLVIVALYLVSLAATQGVPGAVEEVDHLIRPSLTGAASMTQHVGYVAVKSQTTLRSCISAIRKYPVVTTTGVFRGHYFIKIQGHPNTVRAATYMAAIQADINHDLVYAGIQIEP